MKLSCSLSPPSVRLARKVICTYATVANLYDQVGAEFIGTFILMSAGTAATIVNEKTNGLETLIGCAAVVGLAVMVIILSTGHISGAHLNPAVIISFAVPMYIGAQILASVCAAFAVKGVYHPFMGGGVTVSSNNSLRVKHLTKCNLVLLMRAVTEEINISSGVNSNRGNATLLPPPPNLPSGGDNDNSNLEVVCCYDSFFVIQQ
ncbi:hypothetical protein Ahy_B08g092119 [Arachis hypogaea]|uniref:Aquaporin n=1 Tax=Arachis hypogaea TaxID=3818 RepID=A0A444Y356_ARAHY|nr:hypothetical protein Ahy_B08g092119 [Arachis hypogaea]